MSQVATPTITTRAALSNYKVTVTLACATAGAAIYYTTNGDTPTAASTLYSAAFTIYATATIKAIGIKAGDTDSVVAAVAVTIETARPATDPLIEGILDNINDSLAAITTTTGYHYNIGLASREAMDWTNLQPQNYPAAMPYYDSEVDEETGATEQNVLAVAKIIVRGAVYAKTGIETVIANWCQDIERCILVDGTRGNVAIATLVTGKKIYDTEKSYFKVCDVMFDVIYQYKHGEP